MQTPSDGSMERSRRDISKITVFVVCASFALGILGSEILPTGELSCALYAYAMLSRKYLEKCTSNVRRMYGIFLKYSRNTSFCFFFFFAHFYFPASGPAVVTGFFPSPPRFLPLIFIAHRVQQFHCSSIFHRMLLTHALALSASQFVRKKKSPRIYTSMHSGGFELTKLTYTRLEDNLIRHRGDRLVMA